QKRRTPLLAGTAAFMAPEQSQPDVPAGPACDWYSVGVLLYLALTGRLPFDGPPDVVRVTKQLVEPVAPSLLSANVPRDLEELCLELLRPIPTERPDGRAVMSRLHVEQSAERASLPGSVFVGRRDELAKLGTAFEDTRRGGAVTVLVHGESGIGKTMLLRQL